jgi:hypothetical protein
MLQTPKNTWEGMTRTWKDDVFSVTVHPVILIFGLGTIIDAIRAILRHKTADLVTLGLLWLFVGPFLYLWWHSNKKRDPYTQRPLP